MNGLRARRKDAARETLGGAGSLKPVEVKLVKED